MDDTDRPSGDELERSLGAQDPGPRVDVGHVADSDARDLLLQFESVGYSCELGLVQRRYGAEPLDLLRWAQTFPDMLLKLLDAKFEGMGEPGQTSVVLTPWDELMLYDRNYDCRLHTFTKSEGVDRELFLRNQCRRLAFLAGKLREELTAAEKVFVYHAPDLSEPTAREIVRAVRAYGESKLLIVRLASDSHPAGAVLDRGGGLFEGFLSRFGKVPGGHVWDIDFENWVKICTATKALIA